MVSPYTNTRETDLIILIKVLRAEQKKYVFLDLRKLSEYELGDY